MNVAKIIMLSVICVSCNCQTVEACVSNLLHSFLGY